MPLDAFVGRHMGTMLPSTSITCIGVRKGLEAVVYIDMGVVNCGWVHLDTTRCGRAQLYVDRETSLDVDERI